MVNFYPLVDACVGSDVRLNNPFDYQPHPVVVEASRRVVERLKGISVDNRELREEMLRGKMLGVLIVRAESGEIGFLAAFSGSIAGCTTIEGFVPPIYNIDCEGGYFRDEERQISAMKSEIATLESSPERLRSIEHRDMVVAEATQRLTQARAEYATAKAQRDERRRSNPELKSQIDRESQHQKGELRRLERSLREQMDSAQSAVDLLDREIQRLKDERTTRSQALQRRMFESYRLVNGRGEWRSILSIFEQRYNRLPPAGTGDCAAPKLLHYALTHNFEPLFVGEFWSGASPRGEIRREGEFYGACKGKCEPILNFVLEGIELQPVDEALSRERDLTDELTILYEDRELVVYNKPSGMPSVVGNIETPSVESIAKAFMVHRLDQDTSGVILVAKSREAHRELQRQFIEREVSKRYVALVSGHIEPLKGEITLPLSADPIDRPRQMVDYESGRSAYTSFEVVGYEGSYTRLSLTPHTGRTHQLRMHSAHRDGLNAPIVGDMLYGRGLSEAPRLMLHAAMLTFLHPKTKEKIVIQSPPPF